MHFPEYPQTWIRNVGNLYFKALCWTIFTYYPQVWHFYGKQNNGKIEKKSSSGHRGYYMVTTSLNITNSLINQGSSLWDNLGWIVLYSRSLTQYIMQTPCVFKICLKSRYHLTPCEIPLNLYNRNGTQQRLALDRSLISEVNCGMTSPGILKVQI